MIVLIIVAIVKHCINFNFFLQSIAMKNTVICTRNNNPINTAIVWRMYTCGAKLRKIFLMKKINAVTREMISIVVQCCFFMFLLILFTW